MDKLCPQLIAVLLIIACTAEIESGVGGRSSQSAPRGYAVHPRYYKSGYNMYGLMPHAPLHPYSQQKSTVKSVDGRRGGHGLTAWGIVGIILAVIFCGTGVYYCARFYPIFCKKERNDNFEL